MLDLDIRPGQLNSSNGLVVMIQCLETKATPSIRRPIGACGRR